jgi:membrane-bound ClpP family serine protease
MGTKIFAAGGSAIILSLLVSLYTLYMSFTCETASKPVLSVFALGIVALFICTIIMLIRQKSHTENDNVKIPLWKSVMMWIAFAIYAVSGLTVVFFSRKCFENQWKSGLLASWILVPIFVIPSLTTN